ncbi:SusC/RagA family TonB-linked outer membrane protein [Mariniphaga sediminis]|uniref:SusC/RagA family TonB-linked outer membrane protein n=1 Tax=Mariniphaga sediminis TaxID=1628158 RepID=A0A399CWI7_9BACT|nr:TonB-dependent receptor [Mariniphaga sediminis]RIH62771.1 SusC/RagA family TonB-linked outer membrane protein [Mariniphaga sediminis]
MKKNYCELISGVYKIWKSRFLKRMRIVALLILISITQTFALDAYAQSKRLSLTVKNETIVNILEEIENQSEFHFMFDVSRIDVYQRKSVSCKNQLIRNILDQLFEDTGITYSINDRQVLLTTTGKIDVEQQKTVTGKVTDSGGQPLPGVTVVVKGSTTGTVTNADGEYSFTNISENATLQFSFVGMRAQEIVVGSQTSINVRMEEESIGLDEVVAVGYGTMKRVNLSGSVSNVGSKQLEKRTVTTTSSMLQGQLSGVSIRSLSGNPKSSSATLLVRGQGTFSGAGNSPLVIVDGIESSMDNVNPHDVESVSVLKDASSAAIYGSKAANGVILITTKTGLTGEPVFSINSYFGKHTPTYIPEMVNSWEYAMAYNEALMNIGASPRWTAEEIQKFKSGTDPNYPNFNHMDYIWDSGSGIESKHNINIKGGTFRSQYMFSAGYYDNQGLAMKNSANRYDMRLNLDTKLRDNLKFNVKIYGDKYYDKEPSSRNGTGFSDIVRGALRLPNTIPGPTEDGYYPYYETIHPEADINSKSFIKNSNTFFSTNANLSWNITKDLEINGQVGYNYRALENKNYIATYDVTPNFRNSLNSLRVDWLNWNDLTMQSIIKYNKTLNKHAFHLLGGVSCQSYNHQYLSAFRDQFPNNELSEIDAGATAHATNSGSASRYKLTSLFGRVNYNFNERYLFELNVRYDGSSRFPKENRWGVFPSASIAWRLSQENFFKNILPWMNNFKMRASWGSLGNQSVGNYPYQYMISLGQNYPFGNEYSAGAAITSVANKEISWETTRITNFGLDITTLNNKLNFTVDYYVKKTDDILYNISVSDMLGASPNATNAGSVENRGWDFELSYNNAIGDFVYGASVIYSLTHNKVLELYGDLEKDIARGLFVGHPIGSTYGYVSDGLFVDQDDVEMAPTQPFGFLGEPGDIKFVDLSGPNGVPDGVVSSTYDRTIIGQPLPISTYSLNLNGKYKNFDISLMFQGEGGRKDMISMSHFYAIDNLGNVQKWIYNSRWTAENPNPNADYPKIRIVPTDFYLSNKVDFFVKDATFIRLKNAQIGYSLPDRVLNKTFLKRVRFYVSGENLFTLTNFYKGWDPEISNQILWYPHSKFYAAGINIDF